MSAPEPPATRTRQRFQILVCDGPSCGITHESETLKHQLAARVAADPALQGRVDVVDYMCFGRCSEGPNMFVRRLEPTEPGNAEPDSTAFDRERGFYPGMDAAKCERVLAEHCDAGEPIADLVEDY